MSDMFLALTQKQWSEPVVLQKPGEGARYKDLEERQHKEVPLVLNRTR